MGSLDEAYKALDNFWGMRERADNRMAISFITYFKSKEVLFRAFDELSFADVTGGKIRLPEGISANAQIITDMDRIALVFLVGRFTKDQARDVILTFSKHAYREANEKRLAGVAADFAKSLQERGGGGLVWTDWPAEGGATKRVVHRRGAKKAAASPAAPATARKKRKKSTGPAAPRARAAAPFARSAAKKAAKKRRLPMWAIVLLVLGAAGLVAVGWAVAGSFLAPSKEPVVVKVPVTRVITVQPEEAEPALVTIPAEATKAPEPEALAAASSYLEQAMAGAFSGTEVSVMGLIGDQEVELFDESLSDFTDATGIRVVYSSYSDFEEILRTRIAAGDPPDIADMAQLSLLAELVGAGQVVDVLEFMDADKLRNNYDQAWLDMATMQGPEGPIMAGVWHRVTGKSYVWYPKVEFDAAGYNVPSDWAELMALTQQIVDDGGAPWCIGIESGAATGWVATDWLENIMLRTTSPGNYDRWVAGELFFASPEVRRAVEIMSDIWLNDDYVYGGTDAIISTFFYEAAAPMLTDPPQCWLHLQAPWITNLWRQDHEAGIDYDFFPLPAIDEAYGTPMLIAGNIMAMFNDRPEVRAVMEYLSSGASVDAWVRSGGLMSPHHDAHLDWYASDVDRRLAEAILEADSVRFDASDLMPPEVGAGSLWAGLTEYVSGSSDLDTILAEIHGSWPGAPTLTPTPTEAPIATPVPTLKPTAEPTPKPSPVPTQAPTPTPTRDLSTLEKALLGHWVTESGVTNFYIGPGTMIMVEPSGTMHLTWTRFEGNDEDDWMKIYVHRPDTGGGHYKLLRFAPDRLSLVSETNIAQKWLYVDSRQQP